MVVIDIDRFNRVNERHGIGAGDRVLYNVSNLLEQRTRLMDVVAQIWEGRSSRSCSRRWTSTPPSSSRRTILGEIRKTFVKPQVEITASAGVASFPEHSRDLAGLLSDGDQCPARRQGAWPRPRRDLQPRGRPACSAPSAGRRNVEAQSHLATVLSLAEALDQRDSGTATAQPDRGSHFCEMMAQELGSR